MSSDGGVFLSILPATARERRLALAVVGASGLAFLAAVAARVLLTTVGHEAMPLMLVDTGCATTYLVVVTGVCLVAAAPLTALWRAG